MTEKGRGFVAPMAEGTISNAAVEEWENRIGAKLRISQIFNKTVSYEAIYSTKQSLMRRSGIM